MEPPDDAWYKAALDESSDLVFVLRSDTTVVWCNAAISQVGFRKSEVVGRSIADFLHPDDLVRAAEVMALESAGVFTQSTKITPALYRTRTADGSWVHVEINGSTAPGDDHLLVVARLSGDLVIHDRLLESVTSDQPFENQVALVVELATWRHPTDGYAVSYFDDDGERRWYTANLPASLYDVSHPDEVAPWEVAVGAEPEVVPLGPALRATADEAGFVECLVAAVEDPAHPEGARLLIWTTRAGPTVSGHRYAMTNMHRALALVLQRRAHLSLLQRAVRIDQLTGVTSRTRLMELFDEADAQPSDEPHAVLYLDLDGFKGVNDSLGHMMGDRVLRGAAERLASVVPADTTLARMGGDEFVVLCPPGTCREAATDLAERIVGLFVEPLSIEGGDHADGHIEVPIGVSVGVAVGFPGQPVGSVLDAADQALFKAKGDGRGRWAASATG